MPKNIKVADVMIKDVVCATIPGSRDEVLEILKEKKVSGVPVLKDGNLVGIVSRSDLLKKPEEEQLALLMRRNPFWISPDVSIIDAAELILDKNIRRLPVVKDNKLEGIISIADIVGAVAELEINEHVGKYMSPSSVSLWDGTPLKVVGKIMELADVNAVSILNSDLELLGIISDRDIITASIIEDSVEYSNMSNGADDDHWTWESMRDTMSIYYSVSRIKVPSNMLAKDIMITDLVIASYISSVSECARKMKRNRIDQVPIVDANQNFLGLLKDRDILKSIVDKEYW